MNAFVPAEVGTFLLLFVRGMALFYVAPMIGDRTVPGRARAGAAAVLAFLFSTLHPPVGLDRVFEGIAFELALGAALGFLARLALVGIEIGAELIGAQMGMGFAAQFDPSLGEMALPIRRIATVLSGLAFVACGGIEALTHAFALPLFDPFTFLLAGGRFVDLFAEAFFIGVRIAAPVIVAVTVTNVGMGLASRAAPALNVFSVAFALAIMVTGVVLIGTASTFTHDIVLMGRRATELVMGARL